MSSVREQLEQQVSFLAFTIQNNLQSVPDDAEVISGLLVAVQKIIDLSGFDVIAPSNQQQKFKKLTPASRRAEAPRRNLVNQWAGQLPSTQPLPSSPIPAQRFFKAIHDEADSEARLPLIDDDPVEEQYAEEEEPPRPVKKKRKHSWDPAASPEDS